MKKVSMLALAFVASDNYISIATVARRRVALSGKQG